MLLLPSSPITHVLDLPLAVSRDTPTPKPLPAPQKQKHTHPPSLFLGMGLRRPSVVVGGRGDAQDVRALDVDAVELGDAEHHLGQLLVVPSLDGEAHL